MFRYVRNWSAGVLEALQTLATASTTGGATRLVKLEKRLAGLELRLSGWQAEMEAELTRAKTERKNARNAEERTRTMLRSRDQVDEGDDFSEEQIRRVLESLRSGDGDGSEESGVPAMPSRLGNGRKDKLAAVRRRKFS